MGCRVVYMRVVLFRRGCEGSVLVCFVLLVRDFFRVGESGMEGGMGGEARCER
jgi:hypothetical protein